MGHTIMAMPSGRQSAQTLSSYSNPPIPTVQEWEMENDLGDSHCESLGQGGRTPDYSPNDRVVGKIFSEAGTTISYELFLGSPGIDLTIDFYDLNGNLLHTNNDTTSLIDSSFTNANTRWVTIKVRNTSNATIGQKCWVKTTYTAPASVTTSSYPATTNVSIWTSNEVRTTGTIVTTGKKGLSQPVPVPLSSHMK